VNDPDDFGDMARRAGFTPAAVASVFNVAPRTAGRWMSGAMEAPAAALVAMRAILAARAGAVVRPPPLHAPPP